MELRIEQVNMRYRGNRWALRDFTVSLGSGVWGLLGPNGAGKSTLMRILATITRPSSGTVYWNGENVLTAPNAYRKVLGYLPQSFGIYPHLSASQFLGYLAAAKGLSRAEAGRRIEELLEITNLAGVSTQPIGSFSGGMRQRIGIAQALLTDPAVLIVDEPTVGLDPAERADFRSLLSELSGNRIVILSTHIVSDVESVATNIVLINSGRLLAASEPEAIVATANGHVWEWHVSAGELPGVRERYTVSSAVRSEDGVCVRVVGQESPSPAANPVRPSLEDAYLFAIEAAEPEVAK